MKKDKQKEVASSASTDGVETISSSAITAEEIPRFCIETVTKEVMI